MDNEDEIIERMARAAFYGVSGSSIVTFDIRGDDGIEKYEDMWKRFLPEARRHYAMHKAMLVNTQQSNIPESV